jgi:ABC transporter
MNWLAIRMLTGDRVKFFGLIFGVTFATFLMSQQVSIFVGIVGRSGSQIVDVRDASIWVMDPRVRHFDEAPGLPNVDSRRYRVCPGSGPGGAVFRAHQPDHAPGGTLYAVAGGRRCRWRRSRHRVAGKRLEPAARPLPGAGHCFSRCLMQRATSPTSVAFHPWRGSGGPVRAFSGPEPAVRCRNLVKTFDSGGGRVQALRGVDIEVMPGAIALLVGPSGRGKTTLISIIAGLLNPSEGAVHVLGNDLTALRPQELVDFRARNLGFVFQQYDLLPALTAAENACLPPKQSSTTIRTSRSWARETLRARRRFTRPNAVGIEPSTWWFGNALDRECRIISSAGSMPRPTSAGTKEWRLRP